MRHVSFKIKTFGVLIMIFFEPNLDNGRLVPKARKFRNIIMGLLEI
jgi:hypothetical protein